MPNLMLSNGGALGDTWFGVPALKVLRARYDTIYMCGFSRCKMALEGTGYVDEFIIKPDDFFKYSKVDGRTWLLMNSPQLGAEDKYLKMHGAIPGRYCFHPKDPKYDMPTLEKRAINEGVNYFDVSSIHMHVPKAIGKRPETPISDEERDWLSKFRRTFKISSSAFLLMWQFKGSGLTKWYPYFQEVIQENIMQKHPNVYVIGTGDLKGKLQWKREFHGGRFINLGDTITFRQAILLTSMVDLFVSPDTGLYVASQCFPQTPKILLSTIIDGKRVTCGDESTIIQSDATCSPCYRLGSVCLPTMGEERWQTSMFCMSKIPPSKVIYAIEKVVKRESRTMLRSGVI